MRIGLTYDLRAEYLAAGYGEEETAEFDRPDTIEAIEAAVAALGHQTDRIGHARQLVERLAAGRPLGPGVQHRRGAARRGPRGAGAGDPRRLPDPLHVLRPPGHWPLPAQGADEAGRPRRPACPRPISPSSSGPRTSTRVDLPYPLFAKPVAEGTGKGIDADLEDPRPPRTLARGLRASCLGRFRQPVLVETSCPAASSPSASGAPAREAEVLGTHGNRPPARGRGRRLLLRQQGALRGTGRVPAGRRRPATPRSAGPRQSPWPPGGRWAAATPAASTCGPTRTASPSSSKSTRWPACIPNTPTCP